MPVFFLIVCSSVLKPTALDGNCGIDAMAHFDGRDRNKATWNALRRELAKFMLEKRMIHDGRPLS